MAAKLVDEKVFELSKTMIPLKPYDLDCIALAHDILSQDPTRKIKIESLSMEIGINRNKLHYGFKQVYGSTIYTFLEQQRMERAQLLLLTTHKPIKTIASLTRYCTSSRFGVVFKKTFGVTPREFRKQMKSSNETSRV